MTRICMAIPSPWDEMAQYALHIVLAISQYRPKAAFELQERLVKRYNTWLSEEGTAVWSLPIAYVITNDLRLLASAADEPRKAVARWRRQQQQKNASSVQQFKNAMGETPAAHVVAGNAGPPEEDVMDMVDEEEDEGEEIAEDDDDDDSAAKGKRHLARAAQTLQDLFKLCVNDRSTAVRTSRLAGVYYLSSLLLKTYTQLGSTNLFKHILRPMQELPQVNRHGPEEWHPSHVCLFRYYVGWSGFWNEDYASVFQAGSVVYTLWTDVWNTGIPPFSVGL